MNLSSLDMIDTSLFIVSLGIEMMKMMYLLLSQKYVKHELQLEVFWICIYQLSNSVSGLNEPIAWRQRLTSGGKT